VRLGIAAITVDGRKMELTLDAPPVRAGDTIRFDRGGVTEVYEVSPGRMEQKFVFDSLPHGADVAVEVQLETDLNRLSRQGELALQNEYGEVTYSHAVLVDAAGRQTAMTTKLTSDEKTIRIDIPAASLADAAFPVTVDPVLQTFTVWDGDAESRSDVAYDASTNTFISVWEHNFSATDGDIYSVNLNGASGEPIAGSFAVIDSSGVNWRKPAVANNNIANQFLTVAEVGVAGSRTIWGRTRNANSLTVGPQFQISVAGSIGDQINPDVGGDAETAPPTYYCVVWQRTFSAADEDIHARMVRSDSTFQTGTILIEDSSNSLYINPAISSSNGVAPFTTQYWFIAYELANTPNDHEIFGARLAWDGAILHPSFIVDIDLDDDRNPSVSSPLDSNGRPVMVVFESNYEGNVGTDIAYRIMEGNDWLLALNVTAWEGVFPQNARRNPVAETDGIHFIMAHEENYFGSPLDWDVYISTHCGAYVAEQHRNVAYTEFYEGEVKLAGCHLAGGGPANGFLTTWSTRSGAFGDIMSTRYNSKTSCCAADINADGEVDVSDLLLVISQWGPCLTCPADIDGDHQANVGDLLRVIGSWNNFCSF